MKTVAGASGGVTYKPKMGAEEARKVVDEVIDRLQEKDKHFRAATSSCQT